MGYQRVRIRLLGGDAFTVVVFNADQFESPPDRPAFDTRDIVEISLVGDDE